MGLFSPFLQALHNQKTEGAGWKSFAQAEPAANELPTPIVFSDSSWQHLSEYNTKKEKKTEVWFSNKQKLTICQMVLLEM